MDIVYKKEINKKSIRVSKDFIVFFTRNNKDYLIMNLLNSIVTTVRTNYRIKNIQTTQTNIFIIYENFVLKVDINTLKTTATIGKKNVTNLFFLNDAQKTKFYIVKDNNVQMKNINLEKCVSIKSKNYFLIPESYFLYTQGDMLILYSLNGKIYENNFCGKLVYADIYNNKLYLYANHKIYGHDLNIYLDEIIDSFEPTKFIIVKNEIFLFSENDSELRLYEKNMKNLIFKCKATNFYYCRINERLFVMYKECFIIYKRTNCYEVPFKLIKKEITYLEKEDEFDESDNFYTDF